MTNASDPTRCSAWVKPDRFPGYRCFNPAQKGGKCRIHCDEAVAAREAKSTARFDARMREKNRVWSNTDLGVKVRQIIARVDAGEILDAVDGFDAIREAVRQIDKHYKLEDT